VRVEQVAPRRQDQYRDDDQRHNPEAEHCSRRSFTCAPS
jgi:hypothetical protein